MKSDKIKIKKKRKKIKMISGMILFIKNMTIKIFKRIKNI